MKKIKCGDKVKCKITGFEGIVTFKTEYINGCIQLGVTPKVEKDGKYPESVEIDIQQVEKISGKVKVKKDEDGGPIRRRQPKLR